MKGLFLIATPFQCLCAFEAIKHYEITDVTIVINSHQYRQRNQQVIQLLKSKGLEYTLAASEKIFRFSIGHIKRIFNVYLRPRFFRKPIYDYIFVGDYIYGYFDLQLYHYLLKKKGTIVYLDDGASSIKILRDEYIFNRIEAGVRENIERLNRKYSISGNIFFTVFYNIPSAKFIIEANHLKSLRKKIFLQPDTLYIVGTNIPSYCSYLGIKIDDFLELLNNCCKSIKTHYSQHVVYIPHGRDDTNDVEAICKENSIEYRRLDTCIENYFYLNRINPYMIIGFTSTALYTLKIMYPRTKVLNLFFSGSNSIGVDNYTNISKEFEKIGIITVKSLDNIF